MKIIKTYSPGKCILTGEHSVVYGEPAVAAALSQGVVVSMTDGELDPSHPFADFIQHVFAIFKDKHQSKLPQIHQDLSQIKVDLTFQIPIGSGLGSSAALAHALIKALYDWFELEYDAPTLFELVQASEKLVHGNPSGVDAATVINGSLNFFQKKQQQFQIKPIPSKFKQPLELLLIQSGEPTETTGEMVQLVADRLQSDPSLATTIKEIGLISRQLSQQLQNGRLEPALLTQNHQLLAQLGVVGTKAAAMIQEIEAVGGAAKISGAGGIKSGSGIILVYAVDINQVQQLAAEKGWESFPLLLS